jgi:AcrR family transcriptional regulator
MNMFKFRVEKPVPSEITQKSAKAQKTKEAILKAALEQFAKKGYGRATMRDIAKQAGVSVGNAYYYFQSKEEMILEVFVRSQRDAEIRNRETCDKTRNFKVRFLDLQFHRLDLLSEQRELFVVLTQAGIHPDHPLSPFSAEMASLRNDATALIGEAVEGSDLKVSASLRPYLPRLLWLFNLAIILFWSLDGSREQKNTRRLLELSLNLMVPLFGLTLLPLAGMFNRMVIELHDLLSSMIREKPSPTVSSIGEVN